KFTNIETRKNSKTPPKMTPKVLKCKFKSHLLAYAKAHAKENIKDAQNTNAGAIISPLLNK
ncbi:hypothetical protein, partial [Fusobacterium ulcerans]|uniref:hypothetical protein n=1 Tax=Fusobacterium ulcerans TaxID=861 RepID=UPI0026E97411